MKRLKHLFLLIFIMITAEVEAQEANSSEKYLSDLDFFIEKLVETHPEPYSGFGNQLEFYLHYQQLRDTVEKITNNVDFTIILNKFLSNLEDGHTSIFFQKAEKGNTTKKLPLELKVAADFIFVQNSTEEYQNLIGKPILRINGISMDDLLKRSKSILACENRSGEYYNLIQILKNDTQARVLFGKLDKFQFTFRDDQTEISIEIPYEDKVNFLSRTSEIKAENDNGLLYYSMLGKNKDIGYLAWNSIVSREVLEKEFEHAPENLEGYLKWTYHLFDKTRTGNSEKDIKQLPAIYEQFALLIHEMKKKNASYLILDLRYNSGGMTPLINPLLYVLYGEKYLTFDFNAEMIRKVSPLYLKKIGLNSIDEYNRRYMSNIKLGDFTFSCFGNVQSNLSLEKKKNFIEQAYSGYGSNEIKKLSSLDGLNYQVIVLSTPKTYSAAYHFSYFLKKLGQTTIVGVASRQAGNTFMETTPLELPQTQLQGSISNSKQILFKENPELGQRLKPDFEMKWEHFEKYLFDENAELLYVIDLIGENKMNAL